MCVFCCFHLTASRAPSVRADVALSFPDKRTKLCGHKLRFGECETHTNQHTGHNLDEE